MHRVINQAIDSIESIKYPMFDLDYHTHFSISITSEASYATFTF